MCTGCLKLPSTKMPATLKMKTRQNIIGGKAGYESVSSKMEHGSLKIDSFGNQGSIYDAFVGYNF